ncbi:tetratricopeptide repeat protein [Tenacibaculum skagerrakense]|nr:tetratricopeptide repeat protein [Tenacibaculum skagerrakense]
MFRKGIIFFLILYISINCYGQNFSIDSLLKKNNLSESKADKILLSLKNDSLKLAKTTFNFSRYFYKKKEQNLELAIKYAQIEIDFLEKTKETKNEHYHSSLYRLGLYYLYNNNIEEAIEFFKKSSELDIVKKRKGQSLCQLGYCYYLKGYYHKSINYYTKGLDILKKHGKPNSLIAHALNSARNAFKIKNKKIIFDAVKQLKLAEETINSNPNEDYFYLRIRLNMSYGNIYQMIDSFSKAMYYYRKSSLIAEENKDFYYQAMNNMNILELYVKKKV